jgi:signal transduction histidine kinase
MGEIATEARVALDELRTVLGVLRNPLTPGTQAPQPSLADLPDLLERLRASGMAITFETTGQPSPMTGAVELCCYRLAQEALTNAARHAPGAPVRLQIEYDRSSITLAVTDCGTAHSQPAAVLASPGFGLLGMRERVAAVGGELRAGTEGAGFRVSAQIPLTQRGAAR